MRLESDKRLKKVIQSIHVKHKEYGYPRMKIALEEEGYFINHKKVYRLMSELNIQSIIRKKRRFFKGNYSNTFPNVLNREFKDRQQNEALVTDITYLRFQEGFRYLSVVQDIYNNEVVSWKISKRNDNELVLDTFEMLAQKRDVRGTILHSDQGFQYTSHAYNKRLLDLGIIGSHSRKGNCHDNACIESFFSHFKCIITFMRNKNTWSIRDFIKFPMITVIRNIYYRAAPSIIRTFLFRCGNQHNIFVHFFIPKYIRVSPMTIRTMFLIWHHKK